jgi:AAA domain
MKMLRAQAIEDGVIASNDNSPKRVGSSASALIANSLKERFQVTWFDDVDQSTVKEEILHGVLGAGEFSLFVAKPGTAKSVLLCDIGCHVAAGKDWHGRKVKPGLVVFFAAERKGLTERRIAAWRKKHDVTGIPFVVIGGKLDLTSGVIDAKTLAMTIKALEEKSGHQCVLIIIDTVTRTFGSGDQHQSKDMQKYVQSVDELNRATGAHIAAIHHSPWNDDRGKGAIDLDGAIDVSFVVNVAGSGPGKVFTLKCTGSNDGEEGVITSFGLESVPLGTDADGKVTTAPVVVPSDVVTFDGSNLKGQSAKALESLERSIEEHGECPPDGSPGFPDGVMPVNREQWRERFYADTRARDANVTDDTLRKRFNRAIMDLTTAKQLETVGEWFWIAGQA